MIVFSKRTCGVENFYSAGVVTHDLVRLAPAVTLPVFVKSSESDWFLKNELRRS
jgi:hypothetical protein